MRYSLTMSVYILDEKEGTLEIDYYVRNMTASEKLAVFINGEERYSIREDTDGAHPSLMKFYLEPKQHQIEIVFESKGPSYNKDARAIIERIMIKGSENGGAIECKACDTGSIANSKLYMCTKCEPGF